jgi:hypothetical protein
VSPRLGSHRTSRKPSNNWLPIQLSALGFNRLKRRKSLRFNHRRNLAVKPELVDDLPDVRRKTVQVGQKVLAQLLIMGNGFQIPQQKRRGVVKRLPLVGDARAVEHGLLGRLQHRIHAANHGHRQNDIAVFDLGFIDRRADCQLLLSGLSDGAQRPIQIKPLPAFPHEPAGFVESMRLATHLEARYELDHAPRIVGTASLGADHL